MKTKSYKWLSMAGMTLFSASFLTGCADDSFNTPSSSEDEVLLSFAVAEPTMVQTRADKDNDINDVTVLVYNSSDELISKQEYSDPVADNSKFYKSFNLSAISSQTGNLTFYALTNSKDKLTSISTSSAEGKKLSTLQAITDNLDGEALSMSAKVVCAANQITSEENAFILHRNAAKLSVSHSGIEAGFEINAVKVGNALQTTFLTSAADSKYGTGSAMTIAGDQNKMVYMAPQEDAKEIYVLIYATHNNVPGWYRASLKGFDADEYAKGNEVMKEISSIEANHHYQLKINKVVGAGYATEADAIAAGETNMEVTIKDHAPKVYSLITTGNHTLGVPEKLEVNNTDVELLNLLIKTVCQESNSCTVATNPIVTVIEGNDWITVKGTVEEDADGDPGNNNPEAPTPGTFWKQQLEVHPLVGGDYREGVVEVRWANLTRKVTIAQSGQFNGSALGKFTINISDNPNEATRTEDYFDSFLVSTALGVNQESMAGVERTTGLHFPIGLQSAHTAPGTAGTLTKYTYTLSDVNSDYQGDYKIYLKAGSKFSGKLKVSGASISNTPVTGKFDGSSSIVFSLEDSSWDYVAEKNALVIEVTKDGKTTSFSYDLYKTGFFYKPGTESGLVLGNSDSSKYYYYEVIGATVEGVKYYWLDRNIGATAAGMYMEDANGQNAFPNETAPFIAGSEGNMYGISVSAGVSNDAGMCPPGFRIPTVSEFTTLTSSSDFKTVNDKTPVANANYWTAYFADNSSKREIHFPKNRYVQSGGTTKVGDGNSGYYWTRSQAIGATGSEGKLWWQVIKISGGAASPIRMKSWDSSASQPTAMSVRAIRNTTVTENLYDYKLQVTGYTNVYLYHIDETGTRMPLNNWPGDQIIPWNGADKTIDYDFYSNKEYDNVFVILNKVDATGKVVASWTSEGVLNTGANPGADGNSVSLNGKSPWRTDTHVPVPNNNLGGDFNKFVIYWNVKKMGDSYTQLKIVDGSNTVINNGNKYTSNTNYRYLEYYTKSSTINVAPYNPTGGWTFKKNSDTNTEYWTVSLQSTRNVDFTINTYDGDTDSNYLPQNKYGKP